MQLGHQSILVNLTNEASRFGQVVQELTFLKNPYMIKYLGFEVKVVTPENYIKRDSGLIYRDIEVGTGDCPKDGQQVYLVFNFSIHRRKDFRLKFLILVIKFVGYFSLCWI